MAQTGKNFTEWLVQQVTSGDFDVLDWDGVTRYNGNKFVVKRETGDSARAKKIVTVRFLVDTDGSLKQNVAAMDNSGTHTLSVSIPKADVAPTRETFDLEKLVEEQLRTCIRAVSNEDSTKPTVIRIDDELFRDTTFDSAAYIGTVVLAHLAKGVEHFTVVTNKASLDKPTKEGE